MTMIETMIKTEYGQFRMVCQDDLQVAQPHFALVYGEVWRKPRVLTRIQSECLTGHVFKSLSCDCADQLDEAIRRIVAEGAGVLVYLRQEGRGIGLAAKMKSYVLQKQGYDTVDANIQLGFDVDPRTYEHAAQLLQEIGVQSVTLLSNNPMKSEGIQRHGIIVDRVMEIAPIVRDENRFYLKTKMARLGHTFVIDD